MVERKIEKGANLIQPPSDDHLSLPEVSVTDSFTELPRQSRTSGRLILPRSKPDNAA